MSRSNIEFGGIAALGTLHRGEIAEWKRTGQSTQRLGALIAVLGAVPPLVNTVTTVR